jgi:carbonic anhydrase
MKLSTFGPLSAAFLTLLSFPAYSSEHKETGPKGPTGWEAFTLVQEGNKRFSENKVQHPNQNSDRRNELASGQKPHTIVLSCSDSRVPPEVIFDQGLGDIFTVRVAGNVVTPEATASIEYAIEHLGSKLIIVMGHESCGAVKAALTTPKGTTAGSADLDLLLGLIRPNLDAYRSLASTDKTLRDPVKANVKSVVKSLIARSKIIREALKSEKVLIAHGIYGLASGKVEFWDVGQQSYFADQFKEEEKPRTPAAASH